MKYLIFASVISLFSAVSFAQIDDVINKPRVGPSTGGRVVQILAKTFESVQISTLVDQMRRDGVTERRFNGVVGVDGQIVRIIDGREKIKAIPFIIKATSDKKILVSTSLVSLHYEEEFIESLEFATFTLDEGVEFRDIRSVGWSIAKVNFQSVTNSEEKNFIKLNFGIEFGPGEETILLDDGQKVEIKKTYNNVYRWDGEQVYVQNKDGKYEFMHYSKSDKDFEIGRAWRTKLTGGLKINKELNDTDELMLSGIFSLFYTEGAASIGDTYYKHTRMMVQPELTYTRSLKNKKRVSLGIGGNIKVKDELNIKRGETIDLGNRSRQPVHATLKYNF